MFSGILIMVEIKLDGATSKTRLETGVEKK